jgi:tetratricopeptide (TPR) repeat protein
VTQGARPIVRRALAGLAGAALAACVVLCLWGSGAALAQSKRYPPPPVDVDDVETASSSFWERVLHPGGRTYELRLAAARTLLEQPDAQAAAQALPHLDQAVAMAPDHPEGHWLRGMAAERLRRWDLCAESYGRVFAIVSDRGRSYTPALAPRGRDPAWALSAGLGLCLAQRGDYEGALIHFKRVAGRGVSGTAEVHAYLAETYMALGRLAEAVDVLAQVTRQQPSTARIEYALAAAHDRREMPDQAREHLRAALRLGPLALLEAPDQVFIPAEESLYYLGLAFMEHGEPERALLYFRHYLHVHGAGPWRRRAMQHAERLARAPRPPGSISIANPGGVDPAAVRAAVDQAETGLQACVRPLPGVLFSVRLTRVHGSDAAGRGQGSALGVETQVVQALPGVAEEAVAEAQRCLEAAAQGIALPRSRSSAGDYMMVTFPVIAR